MLASVMTGIPFSFSAHAKDIYTAKPRALREKIRAATFVATCTRANQDYLRRMADPDRRARIHLSYHGTNITKFQPSEATPKDDPPLILSAGRLVPKKGLPYLLRACGVLARSSREFRCVIVGEGPERGALEHEAARLGLGDLVSFRGRASQEELLGLYRRAAIFALPCTVLADGDRDGIPNVLMEAMAVELPVVSTAISGIPELIRSGHDGVLVPERDVDGLAGALERLLADATLRRRLGENARATVLEKFNSAANARSLAELFARNGAP